MHGDVKHWDDDLNTLHNVLCDESEGSDKVYVIDFGLSRLDASQEELDEEYQLVKELLCGFKDETVCSSKEACKGKGKSKKENRDVFHAMS